MKRVIFVLGMLLMNVGSSIAQQTDEQRDSIKRARYAQEIGIDMTIPDFETVKLDSAVIGTRLFNLLTYLLDNYQQGLYNQRLAQITREQVPVLDNEYFDIKKLSFIRSSKQGNRIDVVFKVEPYKNKARIKKADLLFRFVDGVTESEATNSFF